MKKLALLTILAALGCSKHAQPTTPAPQYGESYSAPADQSISGEVAGAFQTAWNSFAEGTDEVIDAGEYTFHRLKAGGIEVWDSTKQVAGHAGEEASDATILASVKSRLETTNGVRGQEIHVDVNDGVVQLHGHVASRGAAGEAIRLALDTRGVDRVVSYLSWPGT